MHVKEADAIQRHSSSAPAALILFDILVDGDDVLVREPWTSRRDSLVDRIGKQLNVIGAGPSEGKLWISGLGSATDYANLLATLQADPSVKQVTTLGAENDAVLLYIKASVPMTGLAANLAASGHLLLQGEPHAGADANLRWLH